ncbi:exonuclease domain-containing protein [Olivibacter ginsenosidimutans]|uniref:Exonuclease domain-containing protein n=1 Tax=Olivibacter ginsenosidimutans TaxID=1176537 RepID=A0ABP9BED4_9SPHI
MEYAIVDIETTGAYAAGHGITEIAILIHDGSTVQSTFETLINPLQEIPLHITALTGIDHQLVKHAPTFAEIAAQIYHLLNDKVFVAHNVNFDYSFVKHHLAIHGYSWSATKLCTVRLSRKLLPGYPSYSLGRLCQQLDITINNRHRAGGDAEATAILFSKLLEQDRGEIQQMLKKTSKEQVLPPHLPKEHIESLPTSPGVYYFKDQKGKTIYVGKAKNIRSRVAAHFAGQNPNPQRQNFMRHIYAVDFVNCGTELMALLLEASEIKRLWPENNRALKRFEPKYGLYLYEDQRGYLRLAINKHQRYQKALYAFGQLSDAYQLLNTLIRDYQLCPKLCHVHKTAGSCLSTPDNPCLGACVAKEDPNRYNARLETAVHQLKESLPSFCLLDKGRTPDEQSCIWIEKGKFYGMGYISFESALIYPEEIKEHLTPYPSNDYMMHLITTYTQKHPEKIKPLKGHI